MKEKVLLFKPQAEAKLKKSPIYALPVFTKIMALCSKYLLHSLKRPPDISITDDYIDKFWRIHFASTFTSLYVTGREHIEPHQTYVVMSNHESWMDIPAIFAAVPTSLRMVSKIGLMKIPIFGHAMQHGGFIAVDRKNRNRAIKQLAHAKNRLGEGVSVWIAPEGTRTRDGNISQFKKGGFYLAKDLAKPILPVFIEGAAHVMPADSIMVRPNQSITVHFCAPVPADVVAELKSNALVTLVRDRIIEKQQQCKKEREEVANATA